MPKVPRTSFRGKCEWISSTDLYGYAKLLNDVSLRTVVLDEDQLVQFLKRMKDDRLDKDARQRKLERKKKAWFKDKDRMVILYNGHRSHYIVASGSIVKSGGGEPLMIDFGVFDSMRKGNDISPQEEELSVLLNDLFSEFFKISVTMTPVSGDRQKNNYDCGAYALIYARNVVFEDNVGMQMPYPSVDASSQRKHFDRELRRKRIVPYKKFTSTLAFMDHA